MPPTYGCQFPLPARRPVQLLVSAMEEAGPSASRRQGPFCGSAPSSSTSDSDTADDAPLLAGETRIRVEMPGEKPVGPHDRFPKEKGKTLVS